MKDECTCDARFSGNDEAEYRARGCPECTCGYRDKQNKKVIKLKDIKYMKSLIDTIKFAKSIVKW